MLDDTKKGWQWFEDRQASSASSRNDVAKAFACCFETPDGQKCLSYLTEMTLAKALGANSPDEVLRHLEGQRFLVSYIMKMVRAGQEK